MFKKLMITLALSAGIVGAARAETDGQIYYTHDASPAIRVRADEDDVSIVVTNGGSGNITVTYDSTTTTIDATTANTIATLGAAIAAAADSNSRKQLQVDTDCAVATTESVDGELLDGTYTIKKGTWGEIPWDTSDTKHFRTYIPAKDNGAPRRSAIAKSIYGNIGGTGAFTVKAYTVKDGTRSEVFNLPYADSVTNDNGVTTGGIDIPADLYVGQDYGLIISCDRATTGTTGGVGVRLDYD